MGSNIPQSHHEKYLTIFSRISMFSLPSGVEEDQDEGGGNQARYHHSTADHVDSTINYRRFSFILGKFPIFFWSFFLLDLNISFYDLI